MTVSQACALPSLAQSEIAYQNAAVYALERRQGRSLTGAAEPDEKADPIIVHPDVRRMLMEAKAFTEGARALSLWAALLNDLSHLAQTEEELQKADDLVSLLTPVLTAYVTDKGYEIGRASCWERVSKYVWISLGAVSLKKKKNQ